MESLPAVQPASRRTDPDSPLTQLTQVIRRQNADRDFQRDSVWHPQFALGAGVVILLAFALVSLPFWLLFYRMSDPAANNGAGPKVADLVSLGMLLLGGLLTAAAAWVIIVEMRSRIRMVDRLARTSERESVLVPVETEPLPELLGEEHTEVISGADPPTEVIPHLPPAAPVPAQAAAPPQASVAATLEASAKLLESFSRVLRAFSQLPAQVAMLAVALSLFVGAIVLSLH